ncbi:MAG: diadenylate cyclase CdaA [Acutalibacteraceae bacterium]|nr:diadenylate cyclase CdaA [Acutalibacteraceae bacterium]
MAEFINGIYTLWNQIIYAVSHISIFDLIDILIIAFFISKAIHFLRESRGGQLVKGLLILAVAYTLSIWFDLVTVRWLLTKVMDWGIIALAIIFQPELRRALERIGRSKLGQFGHQNNADSETLKKSIDSICTAVQSMHDQRIGALVVFERTTSLGDIINTGTLINADASVQMVGNVFYPKSPLHDGALIVRDGRLLAAGCILPLTANPNLSSQLGTRHRAAIGMSEVSDAVVLVVSEETGKISLVQNGAIERGFDQTRLREELYKLIIRDELAMENDGIMNKIKNFIDRIKPVKKEEGENE